MPVCALKLALLALLACAPAAHATDWGLSDQRSRAFADPRFGALPMDHVRLVVPWDVAITDPELAGAWIAAALGRGLEPLVAFEHAATDRCPAAPCRLPGAGEYGDAVAAFRARWPRVREYTAWNEPNHPSQPTASEPVGAAALHDALAAQCRSCTVVAGDMVDSASMRGWMRTYREALRSEPEVWSLHNYGDATYDRASYTEWLLGQVSTPVWITETGGIVRFSSDGRQILPDDEARAAASVRKAVAIVEAHPARIARAYVYHWSAEPWEAFDSGLVRADGTERPSLAVLRNALGTRPPRSLPDPVPDESQVVDAPGGGTAAAPAPEPKTVRHARPPRRVRGGYRVAVRCPRRACRGRVTLSVRHGDDGRRTPLGSKRFRVRGGAWRGVVVPVRRRPLRRARAIPDRALVATILTRRPLNLVERSWEALP